MSFARARAWAGLAVVSVLVSAAKAGDWPTHLANNRRNGWTAEPLEATALRPQWTWRSASAPRPAWHGPARWDAYAGVRGLQSMRQYDPVFHVISAGGRVYFGSSADDTVRCLNAKTGDPVWAFTTDGPVRVAPSFSNGRVYFSSDDGWVYCLDATGGELVWKQRPVTPDRLIINNGRFIPFWPSRSGVLVEDGKAYFTASLLPWKASYLCAADAATGSLEDDGCFVQRLDEETFEGPLLATDKQLIATRGRVAPMVFNKQDGRRAGPLGGGGGAFVVIGPDDVVRHGPGNKSGWLTASQLATRKQVATFPTAKAMAIAGGRSYMLTGTRLAAADLTTRKPMWSIACDQGYAMILAGRTLVVGGDREVQAFDARDGKLQWTTEVEGRAYGLAVAGGRLLISTDAGVIHCFSAVAGGGNSPDATASESRPTSDEPPPSPAPPVLTAPEANGLLGRWVFDPRWFDGSAVRDLAGDDDATLDGARRWLRLGDRHGLELDQGTSLLIDSERAGVGPLPQRVLTVEAWCRVDQPQKWGGLINVIQDNGAFERGWLLGFRDQRFCFAVASKSGGRLTYLTAPEDFALRRWRHVAGVYDGETMSLFVDGSRVAQSSEQRGEIHYAPKAPYQIGAYRDDNEHYPMIGALAEIRVYGRALSGEELQQHAQRLDLIEPEPLRLASGPALRFAAPDVAEVIWTVAGDVDDHRPSWLEWSDGVVVRRVEGQPQGDGRVHARVESLEPLRTYQYWIAQDKGDGVSRAGPLECDTFFNYEQPAPSGDPESDPIAAAMLALGGGRDAVDSASLHGMARILGADDEGRLAQRLLASSRLTVLVVDTEATLVRQARRRLLDAGLYGVRAAVLKIERWTELPMTGDWANLAIWRAPGKRPSDAAVAEFARMVRPDGGLAVVLAQPAETWDKMLKRVAPETDWTTSLKGGEESVLRSARRGPLPGAGEWSHLYGAADNSAYGGETLAGASSTRDLEVQWLGRPGPRYQADRNGRKPSPLATGGRLFLQGLGRIIALDAFNGAILWSWELPRLGRFNMPRDCSNWCADRDHVLVAIGDRLWRFDARDGTILSVTPAPQVASQPRDWGYVARVDGKTLGSSVPAGAAFDSFWGGANDGWYDAKSGAATAKVCSDLLFCLDETQAEIWRHSGPVVNSTITVVGQQVMFAEPGPGQNARLAGRLGKELLQDLHLVCLSLQDGRLLWRRPLQDLDGEVTLNVAAGAEHLAVTASGGGRYDIRVLRLKDGADVWSTRQKWMSDNHGGHMSRPAIVGATLYVRPYVFELKTGLKLTLTMPGGGCGTYAATDHALFFRSSNVAVWNRTEGGLTKWSRLRPDCWLSTVPANGLLLSPEGGGGCSCGSWLETSLAFKPKR